MKCRKRLLAAVVLMAVIVDCRKPDPHADHAMSPTQREPQASMPSGASLYQFHDKFTDQNGKEIMLHEFSGNYVVVTMFYSTCTAICPRIASEMLRLEKNLAPAQKKLTRFVMISVDPERDNPAALLRFISKMHLTESFTLLASRSESVREVAAALGINYKKLDNGDYSHSSVFTLLSRNGEILLQRAGLSIDVENFKTSIRAD